MFKFIFYLNRNTCSEVCTFPKTYYLNDNVSAKSVSIFNYLDSILTMRRQFAAALKQPGNFYNLNWIICFVAFRLEFNR